MSRDAGASGKGNSTNNRAPKNNAGGNRSGRSGTGKGASGKPGSATGGRGAPLRDELPGLAARRAAVKALAAVLDGTGAGEDAFETVMALESANLPDRDRALARAIAAVSLRRLGTIQLLLSQFMDKGYPRKSGPLEPILVTGAAQILFLDVADHAAVDLAVTLAKADRNAAPFAGLANAVLRRLVREGGVMPATALAPQTPATGEGGASDAAAPAAGDTDPLAVDTPRWLASRWTEAYGEATARAIVGAHRLESGLDISVRTDGAETAQAWADKLDAVVLPIAPQPPFASPTATLRLRATAAVVELPGFEEGQWWVQDAAASLPARLLRAQPGERVADLCAAPGGKTAQLVVTGAEVVAVDRSRERMDRLKANMARLGLKPTCIVADVLAFKGGPFDAILLDAPCSSTGTIRRHPDVAWGKRPGDIAALATLQAQLLDKAVGLLKPGGRLVYSTCSLEPEEGERQIEALLARNPALDRMPIEPGEVGELAQAINSLGELRTLPAMLPDAEPRLSGVDGFFAARLQLRGA